MSDERLSDGELADMAAQVEAIGHPVVHLWDSRKVAALLSEVRASRSTGDALRARVETLEGYLRAACATGEARLIVDAEVVKTWRSAIENGLGQASIAWKTEAIKWFGQLRDICKGASVGSDSMADLVGLCAWAITLLRAGNAKPPPAPVDWDEIRARAALASPPEDKS